MNSGKVVVRWRRLTDSGAKILFVFALCLLSLLYGVIAGHYDVFPAPQLWDAKSGGVALVQVLGHRNPDGATAVPDGTLTRPVARSYAGTDDDALILVSGGSGYLKSYNPNGGCLAWLMDRKGQIRHVWTFNPKLWADLKSVSTVPGLSSIYPFCVYLLDDGGLLVSFQGFNTWPYAIGMVRLDRDSNVVWKKECHAHHWFTITPDRRIITPTVRIRQSPQPIGSTRGKIRSNDGRIMEDMVTIMSLDGEVLQEISMLDAVNGSGLGGLYYGVEASTALPPETDVITNDPLHLNTVEQVGERVAAAHDWLNADDLLLSFRNINTIAILDRATSRIKWYSAGTTLRQHSPRFMDNDSILAFDNLGGDAALGGSQLVKIGLESRRTETFFPTQARHPAGPVYSATVGYLDLNRGKDAVLVAVTHQARLLEVDLHSGAIRWEYDFVDPVSKTAKPLYCARYCYDVSFPMNQTESTR